MNNTTLTANDIVLTAISAIRADGVQYYVKRLRSCNACVMETKNFYILQSYNTKVAAIDKATGVLYDFLRYVYGYTATSAQHIAKFAKDYGATRRYTYRP